MKIISFSSEYNPVKVGLVRQETMHVTMFKLKTAAGVTCDEGTGLLKQYEDLDSLKT